MSDIINNNKKYKCEYCSFFSNNKKDFQRHLTTKKHMRKINLNDENSGYICECGKQYSCNNSLYRHKKKCYFVNDNKTKHIYNKLLENIREKNKQLRKLLEHNKKIATNKEDKHILNINLFVTQYNDDVIKLSEFIKQNDNNK